MDNENDGYPFFKGNGNFFSEDLSESCMNNLKFRYPPQFGFREVIDRGPYVDKRPVKFKIKHQKYDKNGYKIDYIEEE